MLRNGEATLHWRPRCFAASPISILLALIATRAISANVMIADTDLNIVYMNEAVKTLLREAEADLKKDLPKFSVDTLIGTNIDVFHKNPSHQRQMLQSLSAVHRVTIKIGKWSFDLMATPLKKADGSRAGTVVEWATPVFACRTRTLRGRSLLPSGRRPSSNSTSTAPF